MEEGRLSLRNVMPLFDSPEPELQEAALRVVGRHPEWAGAMAETLRRWLSGKTRRRFRQAALRRDLLAFAKDPAVQAVIAEAVARPETPAETRTMLLEVMAAVPSRLVAPVLDRLAPHGARRPRRSGGPPRGRGRPRVGPDRARRAPARRSPATRRGRRT